ncbi:hypothetical protein ACI2WT_18295 [Lysinibacillus fusiformis]
MQENKHGISNDCSNEKVVVMLDDKMFTKKPNHSEVKGINKRITRGYTKITLEELAEAIVTGKTFMPGIMETRNDILRRSKDNWHSQQIVALDFDNGLTLTDALNDNFIRSNASFLYTTFSHTDVINKFRIVFVLDKVIFDYTDITQILEGLLELYPQADKNCKDGSRIFYGGTTIHWFDKSNRVKTEQFIKKSLRGDRKNNIYISPPNLNTSALNNSTKISNQKVSNIEAIKARDITALHGNIEINEVELKLSNVEEYLKTMNMPVYLGIENHNSFIDLFHEETNPSASIYKSNKGNKQWLYKCFSESKPFVGTIIDVTAKLQGCDKRQAIKFLCELYKVKIENEDALRAFQQNFYDYTEVFSQDDFNVAYPNLFRVLIKTKCLSALIRLLTFVSKNINDDNGYKVVSFHSISTLANAVGVSQSAMGRKINLFTLFGFLRKLADDEIQEDLLTHLNSKKSINNRVYRSTVYEFPILPHEELLKMEELAIIWLENNLSLKTVNYEGIYRSFGREVADRCFPQDTGKEITEEHDENVMILHKKVLELIEAKGWTTLKEISENTYFLSHNSESRKKEIIGRAIKEMLDTYDLEILPLNNQLKNEMKITPEKMPLRNFPKIIRRKR